MKKSAILKTSVTVIITVILTLFSAFLLLGGDVSRVFEQIKLMKKITTVDSTVNKNAVYFDTESDQVGAKLTETYIDLIDDDYAMYFDKESFDKKEDERKGISDKSIGISIAVKENEKYPTVMYVNRNSPGEKAGVKKGDKLLKINGTSLKGLTVAQTAECIKEGEPINLVFKRGKKTYKAELQQEEFIVDSVIWRMIDDVCVIKITEFEESTVAQFDEAMDFANENNAKALVFDMRNNLGGYVDSCAKILDKICPEGTLVRMKYKDGNIEEKYKSDNSEIDLPMAVIINGNTASAAEIFAMNIRDFEKGKIVGETSYGKGIAQTTYKLSDGSAVKFTTATVIDKNGKTYHKKGIEPDIKSEFSDEQNKNYMFLTDEQDTQLQKALETVK
ncbi:MAG: S41 family peptidase [Acutalibacteraceae bacterium]|nr:S41 family peptidase [Acutalibacteraceae bacterium]